MSSRTGVILCLAGALTSAAAGWVARATLAPSSSNAVAPAPPLVDQELTSRARDTNYKGEAADEQRHRLSRIEEALSNLSAAQATTTRVGEGSTPHVSDAQREELEEATASVVQTVSEAIERGRWSAEDVQRFRSDSAQLDATTRQELLSPLVQAINAGRVLLEPHTPLL